MKSHLDRFIPESSLEAIFSSSSKVVPHMYIQERQLHPRSFSEILKEHPEFQNKQIWKLHIKENRSANCSSVSCKKKISKGDECFVVDGALTVPFGKNKVALQKFYFCASKRCFLNPPRWSNTRKPADFFNNETKTAMDKVKSL